jgi:alpha-L-fucosidase
MSTAQTLSTLSKEIKMCKRIIAIMALATVNLPCFGGIAETDNFIHKIRETDEPMQAGKFEPTWDSLKQYQTPEWYRDAKFGIWAHWGAQCQPESGDWYARSMYIQGSRQNKIHLEKYGHPSKFGFKDVIHEWKAENWEPEKLVSLYKRAGAQFFVAMANHHDNFDNWDSKYQPWNSAAMGPQKDLMAGWAKAARDNALKFGVSVHASHAWSWYEVAQGADKTGEYIGLPYDGNTTKADGKYLWWDGLDPQELYAQNHKPGERLEWDWNAARGSSIPDEAYCEKFYNRTIELINKYRPDLLYFDDTVLPLYPVSDAGLKIAAHFYNSNMKLHEGKLEAVLTGKILDPEQRKCMVWDIERGQSNAIEPLPWQTDTCIGSWHYDIGIFNGHRYKSAKTVIQTLIDIVSKNGNLMLNIPVRADGSIDSDEVEILEDIAAWMDINRGAIFNTRPWKIFGEGPALSEVAELSAQGFNEGKGKPLSAQDLRYTVSKDGKTLYAFAMGRPDKGELTLHALQATPGDNAEVVLMGRGGSVKFNIDSSGAPTLSWDSSLTDRPFDSYAVVFKLTGFKFDVNPSYRSGAITLSAENAVLNGSQLHLEKRSGRTNIGWWDSTDEDIHWLIKIPASGDYHFSGEFAALKDSKLVLKINEKEFDFKVSASNSWDKPAVCEIGSVHFDKAGVYHVSIFPDQNGGYNPVNLWKILCFR